MKTPCHVLIQQNREFVMDLARERVMVFQLMICSEPNKLQFKGTCLRTLAQTALTPIAKAKITSSLFLYKLFFCDKVLTVLPCIRNIQIFTASGSGRGGDAFTPFRLSQWEVTGAGILMQERTILFRICKICAPFYLL